MWVHDLADADAACGGKARGLARLLAAQLPVPPGFVIDERAFRHIVGELDATDRDHLGHVMAGAAQKIRDAVLPEEFVRDVERRAVTLGPLVVRSSATIEDGDAGAAAGVFSSSGRITISELWDAIRAVWASALTPLAASYAHRRGGRISIGVIVQAFAPGKHVTIYTRPPGSPSADEILLQHGTSLVRLARPGAMPATPLDPKPVRTLLEPVPEQGPPTAQESVRSSAASRGSVVAAAELARLASLAVGAEVAIGAERGADVEIIVGERGDLLLVQARPIVHPVAIARTPVPAPVIAGLVADGRRWSWDVTHNPDPLSTAQAELVRLVDAAGIGPAMRVCAGYLYTAMRPDAARPALPDPSERDAVLTRLADIERRLASSLDGDSASLQVALERYVAAIRIWADELSPLVRSLPRTETGHRPSAVEATLAAGARGEITEAKVMARIGVLSPAWDVAVPTYGERPQLVREAIARARELPAVTSSSDLAADLAERDDLWFARAQWLVRRALLARADMLARGIAPDEARRLAAGARAASSRAARWNMPLVVPVETAPEPRAVLTGAGTGPRITGRVLRFATLGSAITVRRGDVVVTRAVTPALAVLVIGCAALVSETGGLLDHGAALARELGVPCVVGCQDAWSRLADGMLVTVDGDRGSVEIVEPVIRVE